MRREFRRDDIDAVLREAAVTVSARLRFHRKTPMAIENRAYLAQYDGGRRELTLHSTTGSPGIVRDAGAHSGHSGQSGPRDCPGCGRQLRRQGIALPEILVCALARELGQPSSGPAIAWEDLAATSQAFDETIDAQIALDADGTILGLHADVVGDVGAYSIYPWTAGLEPVRVISLHAGTVSSAGLLLRPRARRGHLQITDRTVSGR